VAYDRRARYDLQHADARPWLYGIAANLMRRHARAEARRLRAHARHGVDPPGPDPAAGALDRVAGAAERARLCAALAALRPAEREALALHALAGLTYEEIARALGVAPGTVASRLSRARGALRATLGEPAGGAPRPPVPEEVQP
jgi:RNA polymerase sigma-70 factor (ECF subfamily)